MRAFCRQHRANEHSFYQWRKRLAAQLPVKFALVEPHPTRRVGVGAVEVIFASGDRVRIEPGFDAETLRAVLNILREAQ